MFYINICDFVFKLYQCDFTHTCIWYIYYNYRYFSFTYFLFLVSFSYKVLGFDRSTSFWESSILTLSPWPTILCMTQIKKNIIKNIISNQMKYKNIIIFHQKYKNKKLFSEWFSAHVLSLLTNYILYDTAKCNFASLFYLVKMTLQLVMYLTYIFSIYLIIYRYRHLTFNFERFDSVANCKMCKNGFDQRHFAMAMDFMQTELLNKHSKIWKKKVWRQFTFTPYKQMNE